MGNSLVYTGFTVAIIYLGIGITHHAFAQSTIDTDFNSLEISLRGKLEPEKTYPQDDLTENVFSPDVLPKPANETPHATIIAAIAAPTQTLLVPEQLNASPYSSTHKPSLGSGIISRLATIYAQFHVNIKKHTKDEFSSLDEIKKGLFDLGGMNPDQSAQASMAFAAALTAQDSRFREAVQNESLRIGKTRYLENLAQQPYPALHLDGAKAAITQALEVIKTDARYAKRAGASMKEASYLLQSNSWARKNIKGKTSIMSELDSNLSLHRYADSRLTSELNNKITMQHVRSGMLQRLGIAQALKVVNQSTGSPQTFRQQNANIDGYGPAMIAALAAYLVLEEDTPQNDRSIRKILNFVPQNQQCFEMAQLNLMQCTAAMHKTYEIPYCIGEHALIEAASCYN